MLRYLAGQHVREFEESFAAYTGSEYAVATTSGTSALQLALLAAGIKPGDEVITTPFSFIASATAILACGAKPVFADIDPVTFNIDPSCVQSKITPHTRAVIGVHLYGQTFDVEAMEDICSLHNLALIEDACQAHGALHHGKRAGSFATGCFSFYPTKNMTTGEGGMITTSKEDIAQQCRLLRNHGQSERYCHTVLGYNARMTEMEPPSSASASWSIWKPSTQARNQKRKLSHRCYLRYRRAGPPRVIPGNRTFSTSIQSGYRAFKMSRDELKSCLEAGGIGCGVHYPIPIHHQPLFKDLGYQDKLPHSEAAAREVLSLPVHPSLTLEDLETIAEALKNA